MITVVCVWFLAGLLVACALGECAKVGNASSDV